MKLSNILNFLKNISFKRKFNKTKNLDKYNKLRIEDIEYLDKISKFFAKQNSF